jgi:NTP pyrophosphatase (non-canonical NTP hydrolase)
VTTYELSRAKFSEYAGMDAPYLPGGELSALQVSLDRWEKKNFGIQPPMVYALGIAEEVGEFFEEVGRGDEDGVRDAVGDVLIYATQLATAHRLDFGTLLEHQWTHGEPALHGSRFDRELMQDVGNLCHVMLKAAQGIRGYNDPDAIRVAICEGICALVRSLSLASPVHGVRSMYVETSGRVLRRNWVADPLTGAA